MAQHTVPILGDGSEDDPYRADYGGDEWMAIDWDHDAGEVTIRVPE